MVYELGMADVNKDENRKQEDLLYQGLIYSLDYGYTKTKFINNQYDSDHDTEALSRWMALHSINYLVDGMHDYHFKFGQIKSKPYVVYYQGNLDLLNNDILGIVGPRLKSKYADRVLNELFKELKGRDIVTISGMAPGVDTLCHQLSIEYGISTIAVLGGGLGRYLQSDKEMIARIVNNGGLVISEFPLKLAPTGYSFPQRNRIIAGLCDWLFLPEAAEGSGSLITVDYALAMHKPIYATPNEVFAMSSRGIHGYVAAGKVKLVADLGAWADEVLGARSGSVGAALAGELTEDQQKILEVLEETGKCSIQMLSKELDIEVNLLLGELNVMEVEGLVTEEAGTWQTVFSG